MLVVTASHGCLCLIMIMLFHAVYVSHGHLVQCCFMQFGKVDSYTYIMDYNPAEISAIQAFAISLSTFDTKLLL